MSDILIKGMEMPKGLGKTITIYPNGTVRVWVTNKGSGELLEQRAVPVPEHGRLIDADALCNKLEKAIKIKPYLEAAFNAAISLTLVAPTVIPASKEGEG